MTDWRERIKAYDEAALADLASVGLVRRARKLVHAGKVDLQETSDESGTLTVDGRIVVFPRGTPTEARCDCNASGVCVHIAAAVLFLRENSASGTDVAADAADSPETPAADEDLLRYSFSEIFKWAGKPGTRMAARILASTPDAGSKIETGPGSIKIDLGPGRQCRYVAGAGLDGVVCDAPEHRRKGLIAACLLCFRRSRGDEIPWPDFLETETADRSLSGDERKLLRQLDLELANMLDCGLMHLPRHTEEALRELAWSARGENLPRLSALVLRLAGELTAFRRQKAGTDPLLLFDRVTDAKVLSAALQNSPPERMASLRGQFKREYAERPTGPLWLCGAHRYETRSGAKGIEILLWDLETGEPLRINCGRGGEAARTFNPLEAWSAALPWQNGRSPEALNGRVLHIKGAKASRDGSLSQSASTRLEKVEEAVAHRDSIEKLGFRNWRLFGRWLGGNMGDENRRIPPAIIRPRKLHPFVVDEREQEWIGWADDDAGDRLRLNLPVNRYNDHRAEILNWLIESAANRIWGLAVDVRRADEELTMAPASVILKEKNDWLCLHPDLEHIDPKRPGRWKAWLKKTLESNRPRFEQPACSSDTAALRELFDRIRQKLLGAAELGLGCRYLSAASLAPLVRDLHTLDAPFLARCLLRLEKNIDPDALVRAWYALRIARGQFSIHRRFVR